MSESTAAPQTEPPVQVGVSPVIDTMTVEEVVVAIVETEKMFFALYRRYHELSNTVDVEDKRLAFKPFRNLKVSAARSFGWAKKAGCTAKEAYERALAATWTSARSSYPASIVDGKLPDDVVAYIEKEYAEYNLTPAQKKAKHGRKKNCQKLRSGTSDPATSFMSVTLAR